MRPQGVNERWSEDTIEVFNDGEFRAILGFYNGGKEKCIGLRWIHNYDIEGDKYAGFPQVFGNPTWFVVPVEQLDNVLTICRSTWCTKESA